ncbi:MAG TPA: RNA-binding protein [Cyanobacteria bacterium UBA8553]|nr:RNA-binding protein [Cyanobacteria bacterium UBA8553]HAJ61350.1 RNA-binding protein [Cyanobacteria bacterium UBA8543]
MSVRLYVGNLPKDDVNRDELHAVFAEAGDSVSTKVIKDRKTGKCRGFAFVTVPTDELADEIIEKFNGHTFKETTLKIEKALPRSKSQEEEESSSPAPKAASNNPPTRRSGGGNNNKKQRRNSSGTTTTSSSSSDSGAIQPDPRWAADLAKLKELLSAQASNP